MGSFKNIIFLSAAVFIILANGADEIKPKDYESSSGGGECDTDLECSNQGRCLRTDEDQPDDKEKDDKTAGKCYCFEGRDGKNCEKAKDTSRRGSIFRNKSKRELRFPADLKATGLNPAELAKNDQEFLIYNPRVERYWQDSTDSPWFGKEKTNHYMIAEKDVRGAAQYKLKDLGNNEYNIITAENDGYAYLSDIVTQGIKKKIRRVMISKEKEDTPAYKFKFEEHPEQNGIYKILCDAQILYASIGRHNIKADQERGRQKSEEIWFQLNLKNDKRRKDPKVIETKEDVFSAGAGIQVDSKDYDNDSSEDITIDIDKEDTKSLLITKLNKLGLTATGGLKGALGNIGLTVNKESSKTKQSGLTSVEKSKISFKVKAMKKLCFVYTFKSHSTFNEEKIEVEIKDKKYDGYRLKEASVGGDIKMSFTEVDHGKPCK